MATDEPPTLQHLSLSRRTFLGATVALAAAACSQSDQSESAPLTETSDPPTDPSSSTTAPVTTSPVTTPPTSEAGGGPAEFVATGPTAEGRVALTFHTDGDLALAQQLADLFTARQVPITAFIVGQWLDANPDWAMRLVDAGHELANHTYTHPTFAQLDPAAMLGEITRCRDVIARLTGSGGRLFRPSGTADGTTVPAAAVLDAATQAGYPVVLGFDVDPFDYQDPGSTAVIDRTLALVAPGSVVSLHFGHSGTITAVPAILDGLAQRNLVPVTASELLGAA